MGAAALTAIILALSLMFKYMPQKKGSTMDLQEMYDELRDEWDIPEWVLDLITNINGWNEQTMRDILHAQHGENVFNGEDDE